MKQQTIEILWKVTSISSVGLSTIRQYSPSMFSTEGSEVPFKIVVLAPKWDTFSFFLKYLSWKSSAYLWNVSRVNSGPGSNPNLSTSQNPALGPVLVLLSTPILVHLLLFLFILVWIFDIFLIESRFWSLSILWTRVENLEPSHILFSLRGQGGFQEDGGTMRQIPYGSALERMLDIYFKVSWNSWGKKWRQKDFLIKLIDRTKQNSDTDGSEFKCVTGAEQDLFSRVENRSILNIWPTSIFWSPSGNNLSETSIVNYSSHKRNAQ